MLQYNNCIEYDYLSPISSMAVDIERCEQCHQDNCVPCTSCFKQVVFSVFSYKDLSSGGLRKVKGSLAIGVPDGRICFVLHQC